MPVKHRNNNGSDKKADATNDNCASNQKKKGPFSGRYNPTYDIFIIKTILKYFYVFINFPTMKSIDFYFLQCDFQNSSKDKGRSK